MFSNSANRLPHTIFTASKARGGGGPSFTSSPCNVLHQHLLPPPLALTTQRRNAFSDLARKTCNFSSSYIRRVEATWRLHCNATNRSPELPTVVLFRPAPQEHLGGALGRVVGQVACHATIAMQAAVVLCGMSICGNPALKVPLILINKAV